MSRSALVIPILEWTNRKRKHLFILLSAWASLSKILVAACAHIDFRSIPEFWGELSRGYGIHILYYLWYTQKSFWRNSYFLNISAPRPPMTLKPKIGISTSIWAGLLVTALIFLKFLTLFWLEYFVDVKCWGGVESTTKAYNSVIKSKFYIWKL